MNEKTYPSDLTDEEWEWIKEVIPAAKSGGRPRTLCMRAVLNAIFYVTKGGIQWRMLPTNFPKWQSVYHYLRAWKLRRMRFLTVFLYASVGLGCGVFIIGCGSSLPHNNGREWGCRLAAFRNALEIADVEVHECANPDVNPGDVGSKCEDDCKHQFCQIGFDLDPPFLHLCDADCKLVNEPRVSGQTCNDPTIDLTRAPGRASATIIAGGHIDVKDKSGDSTVDVFIDYSITECQAASCPVRFTGISGLVAPFVIDDHVAFATFQSNQIATGTYFPAARTFSFPPGAIVLAVDFTIADQQGGTTVSNNDTLTGQLNEDGGIFSIDGTFAANDVTLRLTTEQSVFTHLPPVPSISNGSRIECNGLASAMVTLDGSQSSTRPFNAFKITDYEWTVNGSLIAVGGLPTVNTTLRLGDNAIELGVVDAEAGAKTTSKTLTVVDTTPPSLSCPAPITIECTSPSGASASFSATATDICSGVVTPSCNPASGSIFPLGKTTVSCRATDGAGNSASCATAVQVVDTTPPSIASVTPSLSSLWPPNHNMVPVSVAVAVSDICDPAPICHISSVSSNEPIDGLGDGNTAPDWEITGPLTVNLRAERSGQGNGRVYTITVQCTDASGNSSSKATAVSVPHDQS